MRLTPVTLANAPSPLQLPPPPHHHSLDASDSLDRRSFPALDAAATDFFVDVFKRLNDFQVPIYKLAFSLSAAAAASSMNPSAAGTVAVGVAAGVAGGTLVASSDSAVTASAAAASRSGAAATIEEIKTYIRLHDHGLKVFLALRRPVGGIQGRAAAIV